MSRLIDAEHFEQMLIDLIDNGDHKNAYVHHAYKMRNIAIKECRKMLWEEPTVDAVPVKHGHWIQADLDHDYVTCSNCKELNRNDRLAFIPDYAKGMHYCMICGAKMDDLTQSNDSNTLDALGEKVKE